MAQKSPWELTIFHKQIDVDLLQGNAHAWALQVRQHDELDIRRGFIVVQFVLAGGIGNETASGPSSAPTIKDTQLGLNVLVFFPSQFAYHVPQ